MKKFTVSNGLLYQDGVQVRFVATPNKRGTMVPEYLIEHYTADSAPSSTINWFQNPKAQASAHLLIDREGKVVQFGKFTDVLWHAGVSTWKGIVGMNSHSIGIELTNLGRSGTAHPGFVKLTHKNESQPAYWQEYTEEQIKVCKAVSDCLVETYKLKDILGHEDISPNRKSDPGPAFPWDIIKPEQKEDNLFVTTSDLNLRSGAATTFDIALTIKKGEVVTEKVRVGAWSNVTYNGICGWVSNQYLK